MSTPKILELVPWDAPMPAAPQALLIALSLVVFALSLWFVIKETRRRGDLVPVYAMLGGGLAVIYEPLGDTLASVYYPEHGQLGWIDLFGRQIPLFIGVLYFWYMSVPALYFLKRLEQGITQAQLWRMFAFTLAIAIGIELFGVNVDAWIYYGPHPYVVFGVPLWCPITYSAFLLTITIGLQSMVSHVDPRHHWLIVFTLPMSMCGGHLAASLPAAAAMFSTDEPLWIWLGGTASIALSFGLRYLVALLYCSDSPLRHARSASVPAGDALPAR